MTVRVGYVRSDGWGIGGTEKAAENFIRNHSSRFDPHIISLCGKGIRAKKLKKDGFNTYFPRNRSDFIKYLDKNSIDIIYIAGGIIPLKCINKSSVNNVIVNTQFGLGKRVPPPSKIGNGNLIKAVTFPSRFTLYRYIVLNNIDVRQNHLVLYNPIDFQNLKSDRYSENITDNKPVVGKIGRSDPRKWSELSIRSVERCIKQNKDIFYVLVNTPEEIKKIIDDEVLDNIKFIDKINPYEISKFYNSIDVLAHSSAIGETFGYVIAEAMAHSVPVVVNSQPLADNAQIEIVDNSETGFVANSTKSYSEAILNLLKNDNLRNTIGNAAQTKVHSQYNIQYEIKKMETLYSKILNGEKISTNISVNNFGNHYSARLTDYYGSVGLNYKMKVLAWNIISNNLPIYKENVFGFLRNNLAERN